MEIKSGRHGADVRYWRAPIWGAVTVAKFLWLEMFPGHPFVISSGCEGKHSKGSRHYMGCAGDVRTKDPIGTWALTDNMRMEFCIELRRRLGDEFDVAVSEPSMNIHMELDPKSPTR